MVAMPFFRYLFNTLLICLGSVAGTIVSCSLAAYGFSRLRWRGRDFLFAVLVMTMLLPWHVTMIPRFLLLREAGLYNSLWALIAPTFLGDAFFIFLLRQFFDHGRLVSVHCKLERLQWSPALFARQREIPTVLRAGAIR